MKFLGMELFGVSSELMSFRDFQNPYFLRTLGTECKLSAKIKSRNIPGGVAADTVIEGVAEGPLFSVTRDRLDSETVVIV